MKNTDTPSIERLRNALDNLLATCGARGRYHALEYTEAVEEAEAALETLPSAGEGVERITSRDTSAREVGRLSSQGRFTVASSASPPEQPDIEGRAREFLRPFVHPKVFYDGWPLALDDVLRAIAAALSLPTTEIRREAWQPIETAPGDHKSGPFLVTNNMAGRDAHGQMSHVWLVRAVHKDGRDFTAFTSGNEQIEFLTHWMPLSLESAPEEGIGRLEEAHEVLERINHVLSFGGSIEIGTDLACRISEVVHTLRLASPLNQDSSNG